MFQAIGIDSTGKQHKIGGPRSTIVAARRLAAFEVGTYQRLQVIDLDKDNAVMIDHDGQTAFPVSVEELRSSDS